MQDVVQVSTVEKAEKLRAAIEALFKKGHYAEITQAIGMHSLLIDPQHTMGDQAALYRFVLDLIKDRVGNVKGKDYGAWYKDFPGILDEFASSRQVVTDEPTADVLASHHEAYGAFRSVDDFFSWALDDRRLTLDQIVAYIMKTA
jgi:hypothetical protein